MLSLICDSRANSETIQQEPNSFFMVFHPQFFSQILIAPTVHI